MEVNLISRENIKPSSPSLHLLPPHKICLIDQLTPVTYPSLVLFYPMVDPNINIPQTLTKLKTALSETLNLYYFFSGRVKDNQYIDDFDAGIPFLEASVNCRMSEYLKLKDTQSLNKFIPFHPFCKEKDFLGPPVAFQVSFFSCGGIALGVSMCHKVSDGATMCPFVNSWTAIFTGSNHKIIKPNLSESALLFPPRDLPQNYIDLMDQMWFKEGNYVTRRFVFDAKAIATLRTKATSEKVPKPSRNEALSCFIWKHATAASWAVSGSPRMSLAAHAVNIRPRKKPNTLQNAVGNLYWWALVAANPENEKEFEFTALVGLLNEALAGFDHEFVEALQGEEGFSSVSESLDQLEAMLSLESEKPEIFAFTSWGNFFNEIDFGWGSPFWSGVMGKVGPAFRNLVIFMDIKWGKGIEAWVTLEEKQMTLLEKNAEFLAFASPNPAISSL